MKKTIIISLLAIMAIAGCKSPENPGNPYAKPKYIFLFIGDGMGLNQAHIANIYKQHYQNKDLFFPTFKNNALTTTHSADSSKITDSAAGGTAIASGNKTQNGVLGMNGLNQETYESFAMLAKQNGWKTGILSSVGLNHATPAAFYAHEAKRSSYDAIVPQIYKSGINFFAGGGIMTNKLTQKQAFDSLSANGYTVYTQASEYKPGAEFVFVTDTNTLDYEQSIPFAIDNNKGPRLYNYVQMAIETLNNPEGFFMMVEGGKIDWACHDHDANAAIGEVLELDSAIRVAYEFYKQHPSETLIIVTADHETGGMALGNFHLGYAYNLKGLQSQTASYPVMVSSLKRAQPENYSKTLKQLSGLEFNNEYLKNKSPRQMAQAALDSLSERSGIGWTTYNHTGMPVITYATGAGSYLFNGSIDNTDIYNFLIQLTGLKPKADKTK